MTPPGRSRAGDDAQVIARIEGLLAPVQDGSLERKLEVCAHGVLSHGPVHRQSELRQVFRFDAHGPLQQVVGSSINSLIGCR